MLCYVMLCSPWTRLAMLWPGLGAYERFAHVLWPNQPNLCVWRGVVTVPTWSELIELTLARASMVSRPTARPWTKLRAAMKDRRMRLVRRRGVLPNARSPSTCSARQPLLAASTAATDDPDSASSRAARRAKKRSRESDRLRSVPYET